MMGSGNVMGKLVGQPAGMRKKTACARSAGFPDALEFAAF